MAGYYTINPRYAFVSITHFYAFIEKGPGVRNIKTIRFFPLQVIYSSSSKVITINF